MIHALVMSRVLRERAHVNLAQEIADKLNGGLLAEHMGVKDALVVAAVPNDPTARALVTTSGDAPTRPPVFGIVPVVTATVGHEHGASPRTA